MVGVAFTHRMGYPEPFLEEATADLAHALSYVRTNAESWNADADRIGLMAFSAGALYSFLGMQPSTLPMFFARAGQDTIPGLNAAMDRFIAAALAANAPVTVVNHPSGEHGFDMLNDDDRSREIIRGVLEFLRTYLHA